LLAKIFWDASFNLGEGGAHYFAEISLEIISFIFRFGNIYIKKKNSVNFGDGEGKEEGEGNILDIQC